jgi:hypothetical protein
MVTKWGCGSPATAQCDGDVKYSQGALVAGLSTQPCTFGDHLFLMPTPMSLLTTGLPGVGCTNTATRLRE